MNSVHPCALPFAAFFAMPNRQAMGMLTDIGTEELAHLEMIGTIVTQLTGEFIYGRNQKKYGFDKYYVDHTVGIWPQAAGGIPFNACEFQSKGDPITDLFEDMAAEQKARSTYENILRLVKDPEDAQSASSEPAKSFTSSVSVKHFVFCRNNWIRKTSTHLTVL